MKIMFFFFQIKHQRGEEKMVRIRNPWGDNNEWKGSWSDKYVLYLSDLYYHLVCLKLVPGP